LIELEFTVALYLGIGVAYSLWTALGGPPRGQPVDKLALLVVATGQAIWWPVVVATALYEAWLKWRRRG
jgi:hypothetical protein